MDLIKKLVSNNSFLPLSEPSSIRLPTGLEEIQKALLRLPLVHSLAQSTLLQQASFSTECSLFLNTPPPTPPPWALAQDGAPQPLCSFCLLSERLFLCCCLPNAARSCPLAAAVLEVLTDWGSTLKDLGAACALPELPNVS